MCDMTVNCYGRLLCNLAYVWLCREHELYVSLSNLTEQPCHAFDCFFIVIKLIINIIVIATISAFGLCSSSNNVTLL